MALACSERMLRGAKSVTYPDLADRVSDDLYTKRLAISGWTCFALLAPVADY